MKPKKQIMIPRVKPRDEDETRWGNGLGGSVPHWAAPGSAAFDWSPCAPFELPGGFLEFRGMSRGRSAAYAIFTVGKPANMWAAIRYSMFLTDLDDVLQAEGVVDGKWRPTCGVAIPVKRGQNFGIRRLTDEELKAWIKGNTGFQEVAAKLQRSSMEGVGEVDVNLCREILASDPPSATIRPYLDGCDECIALASRAAIDGAPAQRCDHHARGVTDASRIEAIGEHAQELGRIDVLHEQQLDEIARILQIARRRARST